MKTKLIIGICILFLLGINVNASTTYEEKSSIARIIGESPIDMLKQLQREAVYIKHALYYTSDINNNEKTRILKEQFRNDVYGNMHDENEISSRYTFSDILDQLNSIQDNELIILEPLGYVDSLYVQSHSDTFYPKDLVSWQSKLENKDALLLFDAPYAGIYLPKEDTYISRLAKDASIIAPNSFNSPQFTKSFLCQLVNGKTLGQIFMEARNFHYNGGSESSYNNYIGLILQSYSLYGNPRQKVFIDWHEHDREKIKEYCNNFLKNLAQNIDFLEDVGNYSKFRKHLTFEIPSYKIENIDEFSIINAENTFHNMKPDELVLPVAVRTTKFPVNTIITDYRIDYVGDYEDITLENLPSYQFGFVNRTCYNDNQTYKVDFDNSYTEDTHDFIARIYPVEVIDCNQGKFRLYKKFNYSIDYIAISPVLIENVDLPLNVPVNELINIEIQLLPLTDKTVRGKLAVFDNERNKIWEKDIFTDVLDYNAEFKTPNNEGLQRYNVEFIYDNETVNYKEFSFFTNILDVKTDIPVSADENPSLNFDFYSYNQESFDLGVNYYLFHNLDLINSGSFNKIINKDDNFYTLTLNNLKRNDQSYILIFELSYLDEKKSVSYLLNTNNIPILYLESKKEYTTDENVTITFNAADYDNDALSYSTSDERFEQDGNTFVWQPSKDDAGEYSVTISVDDGLSKDEKNILFKVISVEQPEEEINNPPVLENISDIVVYENDIITIVANASDPDNDNLTYTINDSRFVRDNYIFVWQTKIGDGGIYNVEITVSDGINEIKDELKVTVLHINYGDVNSDGKVNILDIVKTINHIIGRSNITNTTQLKAADVDFNEGITSNDVVIIVEYILGRVKVLPYKPESSVINNQYSPNLMTKSIDVKYANNNLVADVSIKNIGNGIFYEEINNTIILAKDDKENIVINKKENLKLNSGESKVLTYTYDNISNGSYKINIKIDSKSEAIESNKNDNSKEMIFEI